MVNPHRTRLDCRHPNHKTHAFPAHRTAYEGAGQVARRLSAKARNAPCCHLPSKSALNETAPSTLHTPKKRNDRMAPVLLITAQIPKIKLLPHLTEVYAALRFHILFL